MPTLHDKQGNLDYFILEIMRVLRLENVRRLDGSVTQARRRGIGRQVAKPIRTRRTYMNTVVVTRMVSNRNGIASEKRDDCIAG